MSCRFKYSISEFVSMPYVDFLKLKDLTPNLIHYILHCIAMVNEQASTLEVSVSVASNGVSKGSSNPLSPLPVVGVRLRYVRDLGRCKHWPYHYCAKELSVSVGCKNRYLMALF